MTIRHKKPDSKNSQSILSSAEKEMMFTLSLQTNEMSASTIVRNIYECFRKLGDALLIAQGIESRDHLEPLKELMKISVKADRPTGILENLRKIRHNINYYGYNPSIDEVNDSVNIAKTLFPPILKEIKKKITSSRFTMFF